MRRGSDDAESSWLRFRLRGPVPALSSLILSALAPLSLAAEASSPPEIPEEFRDEPAIVLEDHTIWTVKKVYRNPQSTTEVRKRVLLRSREGFGHADQVIVYDGADSSLEDFEARTVLPDGSVIPVGADLVHDAVALKEGKQEWRMLQFTFPGVRVGAILEWSYTLEQRAILPWTWWEVQGELPVLEARFLTRLPRESVRVIAKGFSRRSVKDWCRWLSDRTERSRTVREVVCESVPAFEEAPLAPPEADLRVRMQIAYEAPSGKGIKAIVWDFVNEYWSDRITSFQLKEARAREVAEGILEDREEGESVIETVARFLRENIEILDELPPGEKTESRDASDVLEAGAGLPVEVNLLGLVLLRGAGVTALPVVAGDRSQEAFRQSLPDPSQPRHLLLEVKTGDSWIYWDPACRLCPPGLVEWRYQSEGTNGIRPQAGGGYGWLSIPISLPEENEERHEQTIALEAGGDAMIEGRVSWSGQSGLLWRRWFRDLPEESQAALFLSRFTGELEEQELEPRDPEDLSSDLSAQYSFLRRGLAFPAGEHLLLRAPDLFTGHLGPPSQEKRVHPVRWPFAFVVREQVTFRLPEGYRVESIPAKTVIEAHPFRFAGRWRKGAGPETLYWVGEMRLDGIEIASDDYKRLTWFSSRLSQALRGGVVLVPSSAPMPTPASTGAEAETGGEVAGP